MSQQDKAWKGRIAKATDPVFEAYNRSIETDLAMARCDIGQNRCWARALERLGVMDAGERARVVAALDALEEELDGGNLKFRPGDEDIHMALERQVTERAGPGGEKLQTARSRNDQVVTDLRMYLKGRLDDLGSAIARLQAALVDRAGAHVETPLPGFTHVQPAQVLSLAHYLLALFWALERDRGRARDCRERLDRLVLGSGALAGSGFPVDRAALAADLGFAGVSENSLDAVSDRDFVAETAFVLGQVMVHLSRYCEDWIMWSSPAWGFLELDDALSTGSSLMPQKKNPDPLELIRGKCAQAIGVLTQEMVLQKGLPVGYQKDLQEDKPGLFRLIDDVETALEVFRRVVATMLFHPRRMEDALIPELYATDVADRLVEAGIPFRKAHEIVGSLVRESVDRGVPLLELPDERLAAMLPGIDPGAYRALFSPGSSLRRRDLPGGTGPGSVRRQLDQARELVGNFSGAPT